VPHDIPELLGRSIEIYVFINKSHTTNKISRRSHTRTLIFANMAPIIFYFKRQNLVETFIFRSEFTTIRKLLN